MLKRFFTLFTLVMVGLFVAVGCSTIPQSSSTTTQAEQPTPSQPAAPIQTSPATTQASTIDQQFILEAAQAGLGNIMLGQMALERATSPEAKQFAQSEIDEQTQVKNALTQIAPQLGVTLPTSPAPKFQIAMQQLSQLSGAEFDAAYLSEGGVNAHLENAALFQREAAFGQNSDLVSLANQALPIINQHFGTASTLTNYSFAQVPQRFNNAAIAPDAAPSDSLAPTAPAAPQ